MENEHPKTEGSNLIWKSGKLLVMHVDAKLPDRCIKTNQPANGSRKTATLNWHPPVFYALILLNLIIYAIVAIVVNRKATIEFGVSNEVVKKHVLIKTIGWVILSLGVIVFVWGLAVMSPFAFLGLLTVIIGLIPITLAKFVSAAKIQDDYVWVKGVSHDYLNDLPEWNSKQ
ncbi:MAG: hypothetical protein HZA49_08190 [Planctomycetes bacterium]|nr:hypothetical protein [Planctomycetota bacterium]